MFQDWQMIAVCLIIVAALFYVARRVWGRVRSFSASERAKAACSTGCGSCGEEKPAMAATARPQNVLVQINAAGGSTRRRE